MLEAVPTLIYCASGGKKFADAAVEMGWKYGAKLPHTVYHRPFFADQDWKKPDRKKYFDALRLHCPEVATVLDLEREDQFEEVMDWANEASEIVGGTVIIIPKISGVIDRIPEEINGKKVVLGFSVPTSYGGTPLHTVEFSGRSVHLLGGSPQKQIELSGYLRVVSIDGNMSHKQAHRCRFWRFAPGKRGTWIQLRETGNTQKEGASIVCFKMSLGNIRDAWEHRVAPC